MFFNKHNKWISGFTILELIIVVVIVGVLTSLAIPKFSSVIERARATEAIVALTQIRAGMDRCYVMQRDYTKCIGGPGGFFSKIGLQDPSTSPNSHFTYIYTVITPSGYIIPANRNTRDLVVPIPGGWINCEGNAVGLPNSAIALCVSPNQSSIRGVGIYSGVDTTPY
ncbi:MAG: type IV pilin protein [Candidatus Omnitrophica bacterium]|nr:type IV pilin protein [Candidatus Omnitrophota bacterium]